MDAVMSSNMKGDRGREWKGDEDRRVEGLLRTEGGMWKEKMNRERSSWDPAVSSVFIRQKKGRKDEEEEQRASAFGCSRPFPNPLPQTLSPLLLNHPSSSSALLLEDPSLI